MNMEAAIWLWNSGDEIERLIQKKMIPQAAFYW